MKMNIQERHEADEVERLRLLLDMAETRSECRFALVSLGDEHVVVTTSNREASDYERTLLACFSKAAFDRHAALQFGIARGITLAANHEYGPRENGNEWPPEIVAMLDEHIRKGSEAAVGAAGLTRIAMAPFGLSPCDGDDVTVWLEREPGNDPK